MKRQTIRLIIAMAAILFIGLLFTQVFWVQKAYQLQEEQVDYDITQSLKEVAQQILRANNDSTQLYDPVEQVSSDLFRVRIRESIQPYYLETLLANEFRTAEINLDFQYSLYDCFTDSVVFQKVVHLENKQGTTENKPPDMDWDDDAHYFGVYFPNKRSRLLGEMDFWIFSTVLLIVIVIFFAYTISVILKQRRLSEIKTDFINNMTHELKTPISTISLSSKVLLKPGITEDPDRLENYARIIEKENNRLQQQVEKVLQIATLEQEKVTLKQEPVHIHGLIDNAIRVIDLSVKEKSGTLKTDLDAGNDVVYGDEVHLSNIIANLLENAVKYATEAPLIEVSTENKNGSIQIHITDNGPGIDNKSQKLIFDKFYRVPKGDVHDVKGFGLGLHYVKVMTEYHRGTVSVKSKVGKGTTFTINLPLK